MESAIEFANAQKENAATAQRDRLENLDIDQAPLWSKPTPVNRGSRHNPNSLDLRDRKTSRPNTERRIRSFEPSEDLKER
jgi:hypothetical protein